MEMAEALRRLRAGDPLLVSAARFLDDIGLTPWIGEWEV
jgi:hypothetical protein